MADEKTASQEGIQNVDESLGAFPDEVQHLAWIDTMLEKAVEKAEQSVERRDRDYLDAKLYMVRNRGEIDPHEMFQNELALQQLDYSGVFAVEVRDKLAKLKESPYFARIDFQERGAEEAKPHYIGRFSFSDDKDLLIYDWRAPISSMFYDCETGPAGYTAPGGDISGELTKKRQLKIKNGVLEYVLESSDNIQNDVLQRELAHTSDDKMKSIISTIQKEQNQIIRNETAGTMIIQGVAGSGKTSIALHRIAFLLYRFKDRLSAQNVTIISPNQVFGDYISNVLPELGEEPIFEVSLEDIADVQLEGVFGYERDRDPWETNDGDWSKRARFKSTLRFKREMDQYIEQMPDRVFEATAYSFGSFSVSSDWVRSRYCAYTKYPVLKRLEMVADDILYRFDTDNIREEELPKIRSVIKSLKSMLKGRNTLGLYKDFYRQLGKRDMLAMPNSKTIEWNRTELNNVIRSMDGEKYLPITVIIGDLNNLKKVNDTLGHPQGDLLLRVSAQTLNTYCPPSAHIARIGGDEFMILIANFSMERAKALIETIKGAFASVSRLAIAPSMALGAAVKERTDESIDSVMDRADAAMYQDKVITKTREMNRESHALSSSLLFRKPEEAENQRLEGR